MLWKTKTYLLPAAPLPMSPKRMEPAKAASTYGLDIIEAAERLQDAWSPTQAEDALRSLEHFTRAARLAYAVTLGKENE